MALIPEDKVTINDVYAWFKMKDELNKLKFAESTLRKRIFGSFFPTPKEGVNNFDLGMLLPASKGYILKGDYKIERKIEQPLLDALKPKLLEARISVDSLVRYTPELKTKEYRTLTAEQQALFNQCMEIKPGSLQLKIEPTAEKKAELAAKTAAMGAVNNENTNLEGLVIPKL